MIGLQLGIITRSTSDLLPPPPPPGGDTTDLHDMFDFPLGRSIKRSIRFGQHPLQSNPASHKCIFTGILISAQHAS